jgi:hypothetical protein
VEEWAFGDYASWDEFEEAAASKLGERSIDKPIAPAASLLTANLKTVLKMIKQHFESPHPSKMCSCFCTLAPLPV